MTQQIPVEQRAREIGRTVYAQFCAGTLADDGGDYEGEECARAAAMIALARPSSIEVASQSDALREVGCERRRQIEREGWTPDHDDQHNDRSMALAAACYAMFASVSDEARDCTDMPGDLTTSGKPIKGWSAWLEIWPWERRWWKPKDRRTDLIRAAALIVAEIERLDRRASRASE